MTNIEQFENARFDLIASITAEIRVLEEMAIEADGIDLLQNPDITTSELAEELELSKLRRDSSGWSFTAIAAANFGGA